MKQLLTTTFLLLLTLAMTAQVQEKKITVTENIAYRTDVGPSTVLDLAQPLFGPQANRPAILIIHGGGWSAGSKNDMVGGTSDVAWQNAQMDYKAIKHVPVVLADNTQSGHGGTYEQPNGGANARMVRAWLDWQLKGKLENEKLFIEGDLSGYDGFTIQHKNYK
jgi:hypothetical protein